MTYMWMIGIAPFSWRLGLVKRTEFKGVYALGPLRFAWHWVAK